MVYWPRIQPHSNETQSLLSPTSTNPRGHGEKMCIPRINFRRRVFLPRRWSLPLFFGCAVLGACAAAAVALRAQDKNPFAGDAKAAKLGESQFRANCAFCHGKGGRLGPDLSTTGSARSTDYLVESMRSPSRRLAQGISEAMKEFSQEYETVTVVTADGTKFLGVVLNEDHFTLQMMDTREQLHLFEKDKLRSLEKSRESLMPAYDQKTLSDKDLEDVIAYLLAVSAQ